MLYLFLFVYHERSVVRNALAKRRSLQGCRARKKRSEIVGDRYHETRGIFGNIYQRGQGTLELQEIGLCGLKGKLIDILLSLLGIS